MKDDHFLTIPQELYDSCCSREFSLGAESGFVMILLSCIITPSCFPVSGKLTSGRLYQND